MLLAKLSAEITRIVELPDVKERLRVLGADPATTTPEAFDIHVRDEVTKFAKIVQDAGIKPELHLEDKTRPDGGVKPPLQL